ncbi:MAG: glycosyltransferase [Capsulimonadaceae bacterium]
MNDDNLQQTPIFFDETQRRDGILTAAAVLTTFLAIIGSIVFLVSIARNPTLHGSSITGRIASRAPLRRLAPRTSVDPLTHQLMRFVLRHNDAVQDAKRRLQANIIAESALPQIAAAPAGIRGPVRAAFYVNSEEKDGIDTLQHHIQDTTHLLAVWLQLSASASDVQVIQDLSSSHVGSSPIAPTYDDTAIRLARANGVAILPVLQNAGDGSFPTKLVHNLVNSPSNRHAVIAKCLKFVLGGGYQGINIDLETDNPADRAGITAFMKETAAALRPHGLLVTQDIELDSDSYDLTQLAGINDFLIPMLYDENSDGTTAGPVASQSWFEQELGDFMARVPSNKVVIGLANYGYDWVSGSESATPVGFAEACITAQESRDGQDGIISIDRASLNPHFTYFDDSLGQGDREIKHDVWIEDATTAYNEMRAAAPYHPLGAALWRVGLEDPSVWKFFNRGGDAAVFSFVPSELSDVDYNYFGTTLVGQGDVLQVVRPHTPGYRTISMDEKTGMITAESFITYPSQWVIQRQGLVNQVTGENVQKRIALTFDDGPDPRWTPQILDVLERNHVPATFFVVGENAEAHPSLVAREWSLGMEIGNHSFTHPEMETVSPLRMKLELDATQRMIEVITGHATRLFRAPNRADSEPTSEADFVPILEANKLGYLFIGEQIDPTDWFPGVTADQIVSRVIGNASNGNCVLMHDAGGLTRQQTVNALPRIIEGLRARGYTFVPVSALVYPGLSATAARAKIFPPVSASQRLQVAYDGAVFAIATFFGMAFAAVFIAAIFLGIFRILTMGTLAVLQSRRERKRVFDPAYRPAVSVVIAAYNEEKVISRTISTLLAGDYPHLEIVVVDDGSADGTSDIVREAYGDHPQVRLIRKPNGGKASALNTGIKECSGEIIVALDADTIFAGNTISRLVRHFADPAVGAVSGNVKVGNRNNIWTIWQAVEYITSQNFDRRAFDYLNCITVVPGAVGAWRRDAMALAGMYSSQTLAEDTDLTFKVRKLGYRIVTDNSALAYTEAPENWTSLAKQRFRWAFGTLQCLWKHRDSLLNPRYGAFGMVAQPSLWIFQIAFQAVAPIVDLGILWTWFYGQYITPMPNQSSVALLLSYWAVFTTIEIIGALVALRLDGEDASLAAWMPLQRFAYRQLLYIVIIKSIHHALYGKRVGWGKLERKGSVTEPEPIRREHDLTPVS